MCLGSTFVFKAWVMFFFMGVGLFFRLCYYLIGYATFVGYVILCFLLCYVLDYVFGHAIFRLCFFPLR